MCERVQNLSLFWMPEGLRGMSVNCTPETVD
jgi:hypothetical protein